jgi:FkbM family methyltransferase
VVGIFNCAVDPGPIAQGLRDLGYRSAWSWVEFFREVERANGWDRAGLRPLYWFDSLKSQQKLQEHKQQLLTVLADDESRAVVEGLIRFRETGDVRTHPRAAPQTQYFPPDLIHFNAGPPFQTFIDCGAFNGDTLISLMARTKKEHAASLHEVIAFEPDQKNFRDLVTASERVKKHFASCRFRLFPCAVFRTASLLHFSENLGASSSIVETGGVQVQAVALDEAVSSVEGRAFIKMDLEGAEVDALEGAKRLIQNYRPWLAISIYHAPDHLWQVPLMVAGWNLGYRLYVRQHGENGFDSVLYALSDP